jgi:tetratricopeptide (TPR) repeat protein
VFLALGAKEVALATLPLLLALVALAPRSAEAPRRALAIDRAAALAPIALAVLVYGLLRARATSTFAGLQEVHPFDNPLVALDGFERAWTALAILARYVVLLAAPFGLTADYSGPAVPVEITLLAPRPLLGLATLGSLVALVTLPVLRSTASTRLLAFSSLLFLAPYAIVGNLLFDIGAAVAERLLYLPSAGFCAFVGLLLGGALERDPRAPGRRARLATVALGLLLAGLALQTWARCQDWRNEETLFRAAVQVDPASPRAHLILGRIEAERGNLALALDHFDRALEAYPALFAAWLERGSALARMERIVEARDSFARAVEHGPLHPMGHLNLGIAESRLNRPGSAERALRKALLHDPELDKAWAQLGNLALARRDKAGAVRCYRRAIALGRHDLEPRLAEALALP